MARPEDRLTRLYQQLTRDLNVLLQSARAGVGDAFLAAQIAALTRQLVALGPAQAAWVRANVPAQYRTSAGQAQFTLDAEGVPILSASFTGLDRRTVAALSRRVSDDLDDVRRAIGRGLVLQDPRLAVDAVRRAVEGDNRFVTLRGGVAAVRTPSGRLWRPDAYARMLSRTAIADTRRIAFRQRYLQNGQDVVRVVANGTNHAVCAFWEGQLLSLTGATPGLPTVSDATSAGLFHPNCAHRYVVAPQDEARRISREALEQPEEAPLPILGIGAGVSRRPAQPRGA